MKRAAMMVELRSRIFREPREESGTYVAAPTPETPRQHINLPEIPSRCPHLCATHSFDGDCAKRLLDHQLEYGVHFPERRNAHSSHHRRTIMHAGESAPAMTQIEKVRYTAKTQTTGGRVNGAARSSDCHLEITLATPGTAGSGTNSERLFAAGWSACFEGAMEIAARKMRITLPADLAIDARRNKMTDIRKETDSLGEVDVAADKLWGAQTQRSLEHFSIGKDLIPREMIAAYAILKKAAANANYAGKRLDDEAPQVDRSSLRRDSCGQHQDMFPLHVWMTGSGTQFNMNVNEVISNRCCQLAGTPLGSKTPVHPNDHVNMSQSSNDSFPSAMYIAAAVNVKQRLIPAVKRCTTRSM
jgi:organic hydroperoxide reductase OsmC/OhrA